MVGADDREMKEIARRRHFTLRLNIFFFACFLLFTILIFRLAILQFVQGKELAAQENKIGSMSSPIAPIRGNIYDTNGYPIAYSMSTQTLFYRIEPGMKKHHYIELANKLSEIFRMLDERSVKRGDKPANAALTPEELIRRMDVGIDLKGTATKEPSYYAVPRVIKSGLNNEEIAYFMGHRDQLPGIEITEESVRLYDEMQIAPQLIGYLRPYNTEQNNKDSPYYGKKTEYLPNEYVGIDGIELMYQDELRGQNGAKSYPVDAESKIIGSVSIQNPIKGSNLFLTIDKNVQLAGQKAVEETLKYLKSDEAKAARYPYLGKEAASGYAVAMEVKTGKVVAMVNYPNYDANVWHGGLTQSQLDSISFRYTNGAIRERYTDLPDFGKHPSSLVPLGSTMKPLTVLIGLQEGLFGPRERYNDTGIFRFGRDNTTIRNAEDKSFGWVTASDAIRVSSNTYMSELAIRLYNKHGGNSMKVWEAYTKKFGLGVSTESGLPYEHPGDLYWEKNTKETVQSQIVFGSFGQQARYTVLQLAQYVSTIANRGKRMKPLLVSEIKDADHLLIHKFEPEVLNEEKFPDEFWNVIQEGMESPVWGFDTFPHKLVRKTGTAESSVGGKLVDNSIFVGYAPADNPKLAVAVVVPEGGYGRYAASMVAGKIFESYDKFIGLKD